MNDGLVQVVLVVVFALTCGLLSLAWMARRLEVAAAVLFSVALSVWVLDFAAIASGFGGADGFVECRDECTGVHYSVVVAFLAPPLLIALAAFAGLVAIEQRRRARRAQ